MIRIFLIDDHGMMRAGLRSLLEAEPDFEVVGEAGSGEAALPLLRSLDPDVLLCDFHLPGLSGLEVIERLARSGSSCRSLMISVLEDGPLPKRVLAAGAYGYLSKVAFGDELKTAIREVARGKRFLSADVARAMALEGVTGHASPIDSLTPRELEVALLLAQGLRMTQAGTRLCLSAKTIATHKYRVFDKLGVRDAVGLARVLRQHGLVDPAAA